PVPPPDFRGDDARVAADGAIAWFLADLDPELGRALVGRALEAASGLDARQVSIVWAAAARLDPEDAAERARAAGAGASDIVGGILAMPPAERQRFVRSELLLLPTPGETE
ncbi:MAG: hypothetical protein AAF957_16190, partial [Planctomycetota bacterium]